MPLLVFKLLPVSVHEGSSEFPAFLPVCRRRSRLWYMRFELRLIGALNNTAWLLWKLMIKKCNQYPKLWFILNKLRLYLQDVFLYYRSQLSAFQFQNFPCFLFCTLNIALRFEFIVERGKDLKNAWRKCQKTFNYAQLRLLKLVVSVNPSQNLSVYQILLKSVPPLKRDWVTNIQTFKLIIINRMGFQTWLLLMN